MTKDATDLLVEQMLDLDMGEAAVDVTLTGLDVATSAMPIVGSLIKDWKISRLKKRLNIVEPQLRDIKAKIDKKENDVFYKQELFPFVLKHLNEEDEDSKIPMYINGFEYTVDEGIEEMEMIYHYYDVLAELRTSDIVRLFKRFTPGKKLRIDLYDPTKFDNDLEYRKKELEKRTTEAYIDNKLIRLHLAKVIVDDPVQKLLKMDGSSQKPTKYVLTNFGKRFVEFFSEDEDQPAL
ncbi:hypothetical protein [Streptomyces sp. ID01-9D]|uniref:hypothetical protein n=1 Tax=Streptomyces sp. ID01-9D TaxID=3028659 RepID=UPI0029C12173|nr:hypothetical protein [Streptomyces sp. ID01-9D]MDX5577440.1 hypothetical protein [Streptomyces sp. ID01-9D]